MTRKHYSETEIAIQTTQFSVRRQTHCVASGGGFRMGERNSLQVRAVCDGVASEMRQVKVERMRHGGRDVTSCAGDVMEKTNLVGRMSMYSRESDDYETGY